MADRGLFGEEGFVIVQGRFRDLSIRIGVLLLSPHEEIWLFMTLDPPSYLNSDLAYRVTQLQKQV